MSQHHGRCVADHETTNQIPDQVRSAIAYRVAAGFDDEADIVKHALELAEDLRDNADLRRAIERLTTQYLTLHRSMQTGWSIPTDCDRLDRAFAALSRAGILARQNLGGCFECGLDEIHEEIDSAWKTHHVEGYVFFTGPMLEHAILTGQLVLALRSINEETSFEEVARAVVRELRKAGLTANWAGRPSSPVIEDRMVWRKRW